MNKIRFLTIIIIGILQPSYAQLQFKDSTDAYNYWANRGIVEIVYSYMLDQKDLTSIEEEGRKLYSTKFIEKNFFNIDSVSDFLNKNSWLNTKNMVLHPLTINLKNRKNLNQSFFEIKSAKGDIYSSENWEITKNKIIDEYNLSLRRSIITEKPERTPKVESTVSTREPKRINWVIVRNNTLIFFLGFIIGCWLIYIISKLNIYSILHNEKETYLKELNENKIKYIFSYIGLIFILKNHKDQYKKEKENQFQKTADSSVLLNKIYNLEKEKEELLAKNIDLGKKIEDYNTGKQSIDNITKGNNTSNVQPKKLHKLYFSMPESDGSFQMSNGESSNDGKKFFMIEYEPESSKGELFFLTSDRDQRAINRLESFLKPVCEIQNISSATNATKIELIQSGKVYLSNNQWIIVPEKKIKLKLY
jgi:hypothetical protein